MDASIEARNLTKTYGTVHAVDDATFVAMPGRVLGLIGPNGAGKTTLLRMIVGLAAPTSGSATILGRPYPDLPRAPHRVGISLDSIGPSAARTCEGDLAVWATALGIGRDRVQNVLDEAGLLEHRKRSLRDFSTGMRQRHALATAILASPEVLILDEPANGLDPEGIRWLRRFIRGYAAQGNAVVVASHQLAELEQTADDVVVLRRQVLYTGSIDEFTRSGELRLEDAFFSTLESGPGVNHPDKQGAYL